MSSYGVLEKLQESLWSVSTLQFCLHASDLERVKWRKVEMVARAAFGAIVALYLSHGLYPFLSKRIEECIRGGLIIWLSAFATSLLLKGINYGAQLQGNVVEEERNDVNASAFCTPVSHVSYPITADRPFFSPLRVEEESWEEGDLSDERAEETSDFESDSEIFYMTPKRYRKDLWDSRACRNLLSEFEASLDDKEEDDA